ncbi:MAG TPA: cyclic nucleotide-binding domain-containing protein, partial [candidate division Zixibacteria bacterium]|nr:cyclic nucleotide-binding domain-containing protein [candidate division Zixibacteria bacterium]
NVDIFEQVPAEQLSYIAAIAEEVSYSKDEVIFKENEPSDSLYLVIDGKVNLQRDGQLVLAAGAKDAFGTWSLLDNEPRVVTATITEDARLLRIERNDFVDLLADNVQVTQGILKTLVKKVKDLVNLVGGKQKKPI